LALPVNEQAVALRPGLAKLDATISKYGSTASGAVVGEAGSEAGDSHGARKNKMEIIELAP